MKQLQKAWGKRLELHAKGDRLQAKRNKLRTEGNKLHNEWHKLRAEGTLLWTNEIIKKYGNIRIEWKSPNECHLYLPNGKIEVYK